MNTFAIPALKEKRAQIGGRVISLKKQIARHALLPASEITHKVKRLYSVRSSIVHGQSKKSSMKADEPADKRHAEDRAIASDLLRFVLGVLLTHPEYQIPTKIDEGLLLRGDASAIPRPPMPRRKSYKKNNRRTP